ncbi:GNAT family N-acetyltransferase [Dictyobacter arantiisoli]|uniref:N-acetyltransferase domain-containing protein n=1 Tax=Dictyobacter arantiisoli TaxID=2014874 RepID=A0A5A5T566_9CHLR|nr:GNAT family N-acetyltransferase [Dictyobacter arantiisoli]GCF06490.1 hypothetical protein KDI_00540 [Dictyobacter arantiisoli]
MQVTTENIQPYDVNRDAADVYTLWQAALGQTWPITQERLHKVLNGPEPHHFVARVNGEIVGFAATFKSIRDGERIGQLAALIVHPDKQRGGIGTALHDTALAHFQDVEVQDIQLGSITPRFWPGVPTNLPVAVAFFNARGWTTSETVYDLSQDLSTYRTPDAIVERVKKEGITITAATSQNVTDALAFEAKEFSGWLPLYERIADLGDYRDILIARDSDGTVLGTLIMYSAINSHPERIDLIWQGILGEDAGALGAVGVAESARNRGIGIALVAGASELLKSNNVKNSFIDWVTLTDFYAKVGYNKWRKYNYSRRNL